MKKLVLIFALMTSISLRAQSSLQPFDSTLITPGFSVNGDLKVCIEMIYSKSLTDSSIYFSDTIKLEKGSYKEEALKPYKPIGNFLINSPYEVRLVRYNGRGWDNDPGDYHIFSIYKGDSLVYEISNPSAFNKIPSEFKNLSTYPNDYFHIFEMDNGVTAIVLEGYSYGSQPPSLTVILFYQGAAHLVYYQEMKFLINNISVSSGGYFEIELLDDVPSFDCTPDKFYLKATPSGMGLYR